MTKQMSSAFSTRLVWETAIKLDVFTTHELSAAARFCHRRVGLVLGKWQQEGLVARVEQPHRQRAKYRMINQGRLPEGMPEGSARRRESVLGNLWSAMRILPEFTPHDVAISASTEITDVPVEIAAAYCRMLVKGYQPYLKVRRRAVPGKREAVYQLVRNTGPLHPHEKRVRATFDPNLEEYTYMPGAIQ